MRRLVAVHARINGQMVVLRPEDIALVYEPEKEPCPTCGGWHPMFEHYEDWKQRQS